MHLHCLRQLKKFGLNQRIFTQFYRSAMESVLSFGISVWFWALRPLNDVNQLERIVRQASCIVGGVLPSVASLYSTRLRRRARNIIGDPTHPANCLFQPLPSGRRFRAIKTRTSRFRYSFFPEAVSFCVVCDACFFIRLLFGQLDAP